ncbi:hypothetical protein BKA81DRAFT_374557 [Phyllosticta paracitricarpa]
MALSLQLQQAGHVVWRLVQQTLLDSYFSPTHDLVVPVVLVLAGLLSFALYLRFARVLPMTNVSIHVAQNQRSEQHAKTETDDVHYHLQPRRRSSTAEAIDRSTFAHNRKTFWLRLAVGLWGLAILAAYFFWPTTPTRANVDDSSLFPLRQLMADVIEPSEQSDAVCKVLSDVELVVAHVNKVAPIYDGPQLRQLMIKEAGNPGICWSDAVGDAIQESTVTALALRKEAGILQGMSWLAWREVIERVTILAESVLTSACSQAAATEHCISDAKKVFSLSIQEIRTLEDKAMRTRNEALNLQSRFKSVHTLAVGIHECYCESHLATQRHVDQLARLPWYTRLARQLLPKIERDQAYDHHRGTTRRWHLEQRLGWAPTEKLVATRLGSQLHLPVEVLGALIDGLDEYLGLTNRTASDLEHRMEDLHWDLEWIKWDKTRRSVLQEEEEEELMPFASRKAMFEAMNNMAQAMAPLAIDRRRVESSLATIA